MLAFPWFFSSAIFMITVIAHSFRIMLPIVMPTIHIQFFTIFNLKKYIFFLLDFISADEASYFFYGCCSRFYIFCERSWIFKCMYWLINCCWWAKYSDWVFVSIVSSILLESFPLVYEASFYFYRFYKVSLFGIVIIGVGLNKVFELLFKDMFCRLKLKTRLNR